MGGLSEEERSTLDQALLADLTAAVPEGWYGCLTQGRLVWGNIDSEDGVFQFGYLGVPDVYRVLLVTKSGKTFLSEPVERQALQSSAAVDWAAKTVKTPPLWKGSLSNFWRRSCPPWPSRGCCSGCGPRETPWYSWE